jgi:hypothetical protein
MITVVVLYTRAIRCYKKGRRSVEITHLLVNYEPRQRKIGHVGRRNLGLERTRLSNKWVPLSSQMACVFIKEKRPIGSDLYPVLDETRTTGRRMFLIDKSTQESLSFCVV